MHARGAPQTEADECATAGLSMLRVATWLEHLFKNGLQVSQKMPVVNNTVFRKSTGPRPDDKMLSMH